ncbi:hypothetical protein [Geminicoccus harenae]|uniref:hypothetical protein n=1 Tax=Geminicoccus harenae TaxID=2498453 RepID=UPI00168A4C14|nr:hypothetical protein [Geminicoccus harenae]
MSDFYIISVKHTRSDQRYITLWGADDCGYKQRLNTAGRYTEDNVRARLGYYNSGSSTIAVPADVVERLAVDGDSRQFVGADPAPGVPRVLLNVRDVWSELILNAVEPPPYKVDPQYQGAAVGKVA